MFPVYGHSYPIEDPDPPPPTSEWVVCPHWAEIRIGTYYIGTEYAHQFDDQYYFGANCVTAWIVIGWIYKSELAFDFDNTHASYVRLQAYISIGGTFKVYAEYTTGSPVYLGSFTSGTSTHYFALDSNKIIDKISIKYDAWNLLWYSVHVDVDWIQILDMDV